MIFKILTEGDWQETKNIFLIAFKESPDALALTYEEFASKEEVWHREKLKHITFGAYYDSQKIVSIVGIVFLSNLKTKHIAKIGPVYTLSEYRGQKLATQLLQKIEEIAKKQNVEILSLEVVSDNIPAIKTYQKAGYKQIGTLPKALKHNGKYFDEIVMQKQL